MRGVLTLLLAVPLGLSALTAGPGSADDTVVKVIPLRHRPAADLVDLLRPLLGEDGRVEALDTRLVVHATPEAVRRVEEALLSLDVPLRSLLITVSQGLARGADQRAAGVGGTASVGGTTVVVTPPGPGGTTSVETRTRRTVVRGAVGASGSAESGEALQQIRTLEGHPALIHVGRAEPVTAVGVAPTPAGPALAAGTAFVASGTGFYVLPRLALAEVTLELWAESTEGTPAGGVEGQRLRTTVAGRLGEWIEVGSALREAERRARSLAASARESAFEALSVRVRVEEVR